MTGAGMCLRIRSSNPIIQRYKDSKSFLYLYSFFFLLTSPEEASLTGDRRATFNLISTNFCPKIEVRHMHAPSHKLRSVPLYLMPISEFEGLDMSS